MLVLAAGVATNVYLPRFDLLLDCELTWSATSHSG
jgi:hypothetical protein